MDIDWSKLESCAGASDPSNIPDAINLLFSDDINKRKQGYWLDNHAVVQGDLYSSAPYAARLIVDELLSGEVVTYEVVEILFELHNGYGPQALDMGPLAGKSLEELCKVTVRETEQYLLACIEKLPPELVGDVKNLLGEFNR